MYSIMSCDISFCSYLDISCQNIYVGRLAHFPSESIEQTLPTGYLESRTGRTRIPGETLRRAPAATVPSSPRRATPADQQENPFTHSNCTCVLQRGKPDASKMHTGGTSWNRRFVAKPRSLVQLGNVVCFESYHHLVNGIFYFLCKTCCNLCIFCYALHLCMYLRTDSTYKRNHTAFVFLWLIELRMLPSRPTLVSRGVSPLVSADVPPTCVYMVISPSVHPSIES